MNRDEAERVARRTSGAATRDRHGGRGLGTLLFLVVFALGVARYWPIIDRPWDDGLASTNSALYVGGFARSWERVGFERLAGIPYLAVLPTDPPVGAPDYHHPPLFRWAAYAAVKIWGLSERSIRIVPILFSALGGAAVAWLCLRKLGMGWACVASGLWLALPMSVLYGWMAAPDPAVVGLGALAFCVQEHFRGRPGRGWLWLLPIQFVASQMDWQGCFIPPALLVHEVMQPRGERRIGRAIVCGMAGVASTIVVLVLFGWWTERIAFDADAVLGRRSGAIPSAAFHWERVETYVKTALRLTFDVAHDTATATGTHSIAGGLCAMGRFALDMFTAPVLLATIASAYIALRRDRHPAAASTARLGLSLLVPGALNTILFRMHASTHEFWSMHALCGFVLCTVATLSAMGRPRVTLLVLGATASLATSTINHRFTGQHGEDPRVAAAELDRLCGADDTLLFQGDLTPATFYSKRWVQSAVLGPPGFQWLAQLIDGHRLKSGRLILVLPGDLGDSTTTESIRAFAERYGKVEHVEGLALALRLGAVARRAAARSLWIVTCNP